MEYLMENIKLFKILAIISIFCTVMFTEIVKKFDKNNKLKGYKVWLPFIFSCGFSVMLKFIFKIDWIIMPFVEGCMFGFSVFGYEIILKNINRIFEKVTNIFDKYTNKLEKLSKDDENKE